jgi:four helix bundle protein
MDRSELELRTKDFAVRVVRFVSEFKSSATGRVIGNQLLKSGTSIGANYREANRAVSRREFAYRIGIAEKEASETHYWLEICNEVNLGSEKNCETLLDEANELLAIFTSIGRSIRSKDHRDEDRSRVTEPYFISYASNDSADHEDHFVSSQDVCIDE